MKLEQKLDLLIRVLVFGVAILFCARVWHAKNVSPAAPVKFEKPVRLLPGPTLEISRIPACKASHERQKNAHSYFSRACYRLDSSDLLGAKDFANQAIAEDPGNPKYHKLARLIETEITNLELMNEIVKQINAGRYDQAWNDFKAGCHDNYLFFSKYAEKFANLLECRNQAASASIILQALQNEG